jgi:UDP-3-O-[3-hydroxymyristoyl] glucosamine N-acyltransferase
MVATAIHYTLGDLATRLGCTVRGDAAVVIHGLGSLESARAGQITFLANRKLRHLLVDTQASAVIVHPDFVDQTSLPCLVIDQPYLAFAKVSMLFDNAPKAIPGVHPAAYVCATADVHASASIGPNCSIEDGVVIGPRVVIHAGTVVGAHCRIGADSTLYANVTLYHGVVVGERTIIHSGAVIGADGFGYAPTGNGWQKIAQLGGVRIGNDVEIGANSTVDRGALDDTIIEDGVKIDDLVMVAHNCQIGRNSALAGCVGIAGSTQVGANCTLGGGVGLTGHITLTDNVHITGMTLVTGSIDKAGSYSSGTGTMQTADWRKSAVRFSQLDEIYKRLVALEKKDALEKQSALEQKNTDKKKNNDDA